MGLTAKPVKAEGLSDVKLLSEMCGKDKMNLPCPGSVLVCLPLKPLFGIKKGRGLVF